MAPPAQMDGRFVFDLLQGQQIPWRDAVFYEYYCERNFPQMPTIHGIRTARGKYIHYRGIWDIDELMISRTIWMEMHNLIQEPDSQALVRELNKRVIDWLGEANGMKIPLRRDRGRQMADRKPAPKK